MAGTFLLTIVLFLEFLEANAYHCSESCGQYAYCCGTNVCCHHRSSYTFYSVWYFWFIIALLIMACAGSCNYYRKRHRLLVTRRNMTISGNMPVAVVAFSNGNHEHCPVQFGTLPSYQEATSKPSQYPPPYYTTDLYTNQFPATAASSAQLPPYSRDGNSLPQQ
ncbi:WW domain binding protein 1-like [Rhopilema esculentum]|uniref:WW domain binding protein 1-like n=1 Tax=Rhopilema esculentum TaxID=499914 RepID=UPI0031CF9337